MARSNELGDELKKLLAPRMLVAKLMHRLDTEVNFNVKGRISPGMSGSNCSSPP